MAFGRIGYAPEAFYALTLREWLHALRAHRPSDGQKTQMLLAQLCALFFNAHRGKRRARKPLEFMPWVRPESQNLSGRLMEAFKAFGARRKDRD